MEAVLGHPETRIKPTRLDIKKIVICLRANRKRGVTPQNISKKISRHNNLHRTPEFVGRVLNSLYHKGHARVECGPNKWRLTVDSKKELAKLC